MVGPSSMVVGPSSIVVGPPSTVDDMWDRQLKVTVEVAIGAPHGQTASTHNWTLL